MQKLPQFLAMLLAATAMIGCASTKVAIMSSGRSEPEVVVLLHGLARTNRSMNRMQKELGTAGYTVYSLQYPSTTKTVEQIAEEDLAPLLARCEAAHPGRIHFVTHSLGGIVVRQYLTRHTLRNPGRVVMLAPPNQGSEAVDKLGHLTLFDWIYGPAGRQLGTTPDSLPMQLPAPPVEVGVIAGTRSFNWILSRMIPGPDDGKVSVERTRLPGMVDFATVDSSHPYIMRNQEVMGLTLAFLKNGSFE